MKKFLYKKINEIYSEDLFNSDYNNNKKMLPFLRQFKFIEKKQNYAYENIDLYSYLTSLIYISTKYPKKTCILFYKIGFDLLSKKSLLCNKTNKITNIEEDGNIEQNIYNFQRISAKDSLTISHYKTQTAEEKEFELDQIIEGLTLIFSRKLNRNIIQDDEVFFTMINSLILFLKEIKKMIYI
jgi:hypothetical protein